MRECKLVNNLVSVIGYEEGKNMRIIYKQLVSLKSMCNGHFIRSKEVESSIIPKKGEFIEENIYGYSYKIEIVQVSINRLKDECEVILKNMQFEHDNNNFFMKFYHDVAMNKWSVGKLY